MKFSLGAIKFLLELHRKNHNHCCGGTTMWMQYMPLNYTLKNKRNEWLLCVPIRMDLKNVILTKSNQIQKYIPYDSNQNLGLLMWWDWLEGSMKKISEMIEMFCILIGVVIIQMYVYICGNSLKYALKSCALSWM